MSQIEEIKLQSDIPEIKLDYSNPDPSEPIRIGNENFMQDMAGIEPTVDFNGARSVAALELNQEEMGEVYSATEDNLRNGNMTPIQAEEFIGAYKPRTTVEDTETGLEKLAVRNGKADAITYNESTKWNTVSSGVDLDKEEEENARDLMLDNYKDLFYDGGNGKGIAGAVEFAAGTIGSYIGAQAFELNFGGITGIKDLPLSVSDEESQQKLAEWARKNIFEVPLDVAKKNIEGVWKFCENYGIPALWRRRFFDAAIMNEKENPLWSSIAMASFGMLGGLKNTFKSANKAYRWTKKLGNKEAATSIAVEAIQNGNKSAEAVLEHNVPSLLKPTSDDTVSMFNRAKPVEDVLLDTEIESIIRDGRASGLFDEVAEDILYKVAAKQVEQLNDEIAGSRYLDLKVVKGKAGETIAEVLIGGGLDGKKAMATGEECRQVIKQIGLPQGTYKIVEGEGGYFIKYSQPVKFEDNFYKTLPNIAEEVPNIAEEARKNYEATVNEFSRLHAKDYTKWFFGHFAESAEAHGRVSEAQRKASGMVKRLYEHFAKDLKINKKSAKTVARVIDEGQLENNKLGKWFTKEELVDKGLNDTEISAYFAYKKLNDTLYRTMDDSFIRDASAQGFSFYQGKYVARPVEYGPQTPELINHIYIEGGVKDAKKLLDDLKNGRKVLLEKHYKRIMGDNNKFTHVVVDAQQIDKRLIPHGLTPYQAGGIRRYQRGTYFLKQGVTLQGVRGKFNGWANTLTTSMSRTAANEFAEECNTLIKAYNAGGALDDRVMQEAINSLKTRRTKINDVEDFKKVLYNEENGKGWLRTDNTVEVLEDGKKYTYNNGVTDSIEQHAANTEDAFRDLVADAVGNKYSRGEMLTSIDDDVPPLLDFRKIADEAIGRAARTNTIEETKKWWKETFAENFSHLVDYGPTGPIDRLDLIDKAVIDMNRGAGYEKEIRAALNMQDRYKMLIGAETATDKIVKRTMLNLANSLTDNDLVPLLKRGGTLYDWLKDSRPDKFVTKVEFASAMGFLNPAQFLKQALGLTVTFSARPLRTMQALMAYPFLRAAFKFRNKPGIIKAVSEHLASIGMMSKQKAVDFVKFMERTDSLGATGRLPMISESHWKAIQNSKIAQGMYWFADAGNNLVYGVSDIVAFLEGSSKGWNDLKILSHADDLALNMTRAGNSWGQRELPWLMQWTSYPLRLLESSFNSRLTKMQRAQIWGGQLAMWGLGGALGEKAAVNAYNWLANENEVDPEVSKVIVNGLLTNLANEYGYEISEGLDFGEMLERFADIHNKAGNGNVIFNIPALRIWSRMGAAYNLIRDIYHTATVDDASLMMFAMKAAEDKDLPTGIRKMANLYTGLTTNLMYFYDTDFKTKYKEVTGKDIFMYTAGLEPLEIKDARTKKLVGEMFRDTVKSSVDSATIESFLDQTFPEYLENLHLKDHLIALGVDSRTHNENITAAAEAVKKLRMLEEIAKRDIKATFGNVEDVTLDKAVGDYVSKKAFSLKSIQQVKYETELPRDVEQSFESLIHTKGEK